MFCVPWACKKGEEYESPRCSACRAAARTHSRRPHNSMPLARRRAHCWPHCSLKRERYLQEGTSASGTADQSQEALTEQQQGHEQQQQGSVAAAAAKVLTAKMPGSMAVRAYLQLPSLKKAPPEVRRGDVIDDVIDDVTQVSLCLTRHDFKVVEKLWVKKDVVVPDLIPQANNIEYTYLPLPSRPTKKKEKVSKGGDFQSGKGPSLISRFSFNKQTVRQQLRMTMAQ